jgi:bifunctional non-homologous end joining protein LigD
LIVEAALRHKAASFVMDGEAVLLGVDGISDFDAMHSRQHDDEVQFYAFDLLVANGEDLRSLPLHLRKNNLARMLARRIDGIMLNDYEQGGIGPDLFRHACLMGLEGLVSKRKDSRYKGSRSPDWVKVKNPKSPAMNRAKDGLASSHHTPLRGPLAASIVCAMPKVVPVTFANPAVGVRRLRRGPMSSFFRRKSRSRRAPGETRRPHQRPHR